MRHGPPRRQPARGLTFFFVLEGVEAPTSQTDSPDERCFAWWGGSEGGYPPIFDAVSVTL